MTDATPTATHQAIEAVWRAECATIVATVARLTRDVGLAEECAQDALLAALQHWPAEGLPDKPGAWLTTAAKHKALDHLRHHALRDQRLSELGADADALGAAVVPDIAEQIDAQRADDIGDDLLRLIFIACHPVLAMDARLALTLRLLAGLSTAEIARACLVAEPTMAQRIVRAKRALSAAQVPFELPPPAQRRARLDSVLEVIYLLFNEGYAATAGSDWMRPALCDEALRLGRLLARLMPDEPEVAGLLALLELQASRTAARQDGRGQPVLLADQDRSRWDRLQIRRGLAALDHAHHLVEARGQSPGPYALQAAIAACHAGAPRAEDTDWAAIAALYDALMAELPTPVVALNRAVAVGMAHGPDAGLAQLQPLLAEPRLADYPWLHAAQGDLLARTGRQDEARAAFEHAARLTRNLSDQRLLRERAAALGPGSAPRHGGG